MQYVQKEQQKRRNLIPKQGFVMGRVEGDDVDDDDSDVMGRWPGYETLCLGKSQALICKYRIRYYLYVTNTSCTTASAKFRTTSDADSRNAKNFTNC